MNATHAYRDGEWSYVSGSSNVIGETPRSINSAFNLPDEVSTPATPTMSDEGKSDTVNDALIGPRANSNQGFSALFSDETIVAPPALTRLSSKQFSSRDDFSCDPSITLFNGKDAPSPK